jgi:hypothetical protein
VSLIQIEVQYGYARCAVDTRITRAQVPDLPTPEASKLCAIPHAGCVTAGRGGIAAFWTLNSFILRNPSLHDFDSIVEGMSGMVDWLAHNIQIPTDGFEPGIEVFVLGWSDAARQMNVVGLKIDLRNNRCERIPMGRSAIAPPRPLDCRYGFHGLATDEAMLELAQQQLQWMTENVPADATGGRLLVAEVTRHEIRIHDAGAISDLGPDGAL